MLMAFYCISIHTFRPQQHPADLSLEAEQAPELSAATQMLAMPFFARLVATSTPQALQQLSAQWRTLFSAVGAT